MADSQTISAIDENSATRAPSFSSVTAYKVTPAKPAATPSDSAVLSITAQALLLEQQGYNVVEIANQLGISATTVQTDLGISSSSYQAKAATAASTAS